MIDDHDPKIVVEMAKHFDKSQVGATRKTLEMSSHRNSSGRNLRDERRSLGIDSDDVQIVVEEHRVLVKEDGGYM